MTKLYLASFAIFMSIFGLEAQTIKGRIIDQNKTAVSDAYIFYNGDKAHTHSNQNGEFQIETISIGDTIRIRHLDYNDFFHIVQEGSKVVTFNLEEKTFSLETLTVDSQVDGVSLFSKIDLKTNPVNSSQEILRNVPGLFIGQHAGGGKAEQIFLRGFDVDHGTDVSIEVDGMPVNMVSHAHGQGYADLHFLIPETVETINFGKGSYDASKGNFTTAGHVGFKTKNRLNSSRIGFGIGQFNTKEVLGLFDLVNTEDHAAYLAAEFTGTDGPFDSPQNFSRTNIFGKYTAKLNKVDELSLSVSHFSSQWDASGQIPNRAVVNGTIGRFGAIDDTEGGQTSRSNVILNYRKYTDSKTFIDNTLFYTHYDFELYSNFTFFLDDPVNGDQIKQKEDRHMYGFQSELNRSIQLDRSEILFKAAIGMRQDYSQDNELSHTKNREEILERMAYGNINENNLYGHVSAEWLLGKLSIVPAVRLDNFHYQYEDHLIEDYNTQSTQATIVSPKLNLSYQLSKNAQLYVKAGKGFHSNDTRVSINNDSLLTLPASYGADIGMIIKPSSKMLINVAVWHLDLEQEFVYVGDAGIVEASGETRRYGLDFSSRYQLGSHWFLSADLNYTHAQALNTDVGESYIPLAPKFTGVGGISYSTEKGLYGSIKARHMGDRAANEDNSIVAKGYTVLDMNLGYAFKHLNIEMGINNLLNTEWNETQFATESRLANEAEAVEEIHFTPGTPFFAKCSISYRF